MEEILKQILDELKNIHNELKSQEEIMSTRVYTINTLADYLGLDYGTVRKWTKNGLKSRRVGRNTFILGQSILDFFNEETDLKYSEDSNDRITQKLGKAF